MATATQTRPQEKTGNWTAIFPNEQVTEQQSALFVKKLLAVAISNITYLRAIFPEHAFGDRCLEDLNLKILRDDSTCPGACQVIKWVKGCFDALDKKYLRMLVIGIYVDPAEENTVIESYTFKFTYTDNGGIDIYRNDKKISSAYTPAETKKATIRLLRTIVVLTQTLKSLPDDVMMTMKLLYYDEDTPSDYEPPGFRSSDNDSFYFEEQPMNIKVGDVATPFHTVKMRIKTDGKQFELKEDNEEEAMAEEEEQEIHSEGLDKADSLEEMDTVDRSVVEDAKEFSSPFQVPTQCEDVPQQSPAKPVKDQTVPSPLPVDGDEDNGVKCPCGCNEDDGLMVLCCVCKFWQHGVCFMIVDEDDAPEKHVCNDCGSMDNPGTEPTDPYLVGLSSIAVQATCLWRRAIMACTETSRVLQPTFARRLGVEVTVAQGLMNRLEKEGFIKNPSKGKRLGKIVNKDKILTDGLAKYFKKQNREINSKTEEPELRKSDSTKVPADSSILFDVTSGTAKVTSSSNEIEVLAEITGDLNLNGRKKKTAKNSEKSSKSSAVNKHVHQVRHSPRLSEQDKIIETVVEKQRRGKKRAIAKVDKAAEFDVSNSQDVEYDSGHLGKRKASVAAKAIMV